MGPLHRPGRVTIDGRDMLLQLGPSSPRVAIPCGGVEGVVAAAGRLASSGSPPGVKAVEVRLRPPLLQFRRLAGFPRLRTAALRAAVDLQASRIFRQDGGSLVTDAVAVPTPDGESIVAAAAADERFLDALLAALRERGVSVIDVRPDEALGLPPLALDPPSSARARAASRRRSLRGWLAVAALSWLGFGVAAGVRVHQRLAIAERDFAALRPPMEALRGARGRMTAAQTMLDALAIADHERGRLLSLLGTVAGGLPDSVVLTSLDLSVEGPGAMSGLAASPLTVMAAFERWPRFTAPHLNSPPLRAPEDPAGWSRFSLGFEVSR